MTLASADPSFGNRERLVVAALFDGSGERIDQATIDDLFLVPTADIGPWSSAFPDDRVGPIDAQARTEIIGDAEQNPDNGWTRRRRSSTPTQTIWKRRPMYGSRSLMTKQGQQRKRCAATMQYRSTKKLRRNAASKLFRPRPTNLS